jgi:hypothetical protein
MFSQLSFTCLENFLKLFTEFFFLEQFLDCLQVISDVSLLLACSILTAHLLEPPKIIDRSISGTYENMSRSQNHVSPRNTFLENIYLGRQVKTNTISDGENDSNYDNNTGEVLMNNFIADDQENTVANNLNEDQQTNICGDHDIMQEETQLYVDELRSNLTSAVQDSLNIESVTTGAENSNLFQKIEMEKDKQLLLPVPVFYNEMENSGADSDILENVINGTAGKLINDGTCLVLVLYIKQTKTDHGRIQNSEERKSYYDMVSAAYTNLFYRQLFHSNFC